MTTAPTALPALRDNYIWAFALPHGDRVAVVDPGEDGPVEAWLARGQLRLGAILLTHHHGDHVAGAVPLAQRHRVPVVAPDDARIAGVTRVARDGDRLDDVFDGLAARTIAVPGHTRSHIAYVVGDAWLFCGDTLFAAGCGRLFEGTPAQMHASLSRLAVLPPSLLVCCGHEYTADNCRFALTVDPENAALQARAERVGALRAQGLPSVPDTLAAELATNPFLRCDAPAVRDFARRAGANDDDAVAVFAAVRAAKDAFA